MRHAAFHKPVVDGPLGAILSHVARHIAHYPIRTRGTFCGSLAHADPASEWCLVAATLDATIVAKSTRGERLIAAKDFFAGIMTTALAEDELLAEVRLPVPAAGTKFGFNEFNRRAGDFAMAASLVCYRLQGGKIIDARVGVGGAETFPRRIAQAEAALNGQAPGDKVFRAAAETAAKAIEPLEDHQTSGEYRRDLVRAVVRRALEHGLAMSAHGTRGAGMTWVGRAIRRLEDPALVQGQGRFTADLPAAYCVRFVRSPVAAGKIKKIDVPKGTTRDYRRRSENREAYFADAAQVRLQAGRAARFDGRHGAVRR